MIPTSLPVRRTSLEESSQTETFEHDMLLLHHTHAAALEKVYEEERKSKDWPNCDGLVPYSQMWSLIHWLKQAQLGGWELVNDQPVFDSDENGRIHPGTCRWLCELERDGQTVRGVGYCQSTAMCIATLNAHRIDAPVIHTPTSDSQGR